MKSMFRAIAESAGYSLMPLWRLPLHPHASFMKRLFTTYEVDFVIDVGANVGQFRNFIRLHCDYHGLGLSFEPNPECVSELCAKIEADPNWALEACALGAQNTELELNIMRKNTFSSFRIPDSTRVPELADHNELASRRHVPVKRLDSIDLQQYFGSRPHAIFLKLDTQGFDLEVLEGASELLRCVVAIQLEASVIPIYQDVPLFAETVTALEELGFTVAHAFPVTHDSGLRAIEFDLVFVNNTNADQVLALG